MSSFAVGEPVDQKPDEVLPPLPPATGLDALFDDPPLVLSEATQPVAPDSDSDDDGGLFGDDDDEPECVSWMQVGWRWQLTVDVAVRRSRWNRTTG